MNSPINLSCILRINDVDPSTVYHLTVQGLEIERLKLEAYESSYNVAGYSRSLRKIFEYQRVLSMIRFDTLDSISGKFQSTN
jgi:hypothetical protein